MKHNKHIEDKDLNKEVDEILNNEPQEAEGAEGNTENTAEAEASEQQSAEQQSPEQQIEALQKRVAELEERPTNVYADQYVNLQQLYASVEHG